MLPYNKSLKGNARALRKNMTNAEILLWSRIKGKQLKGYQFYRQKIIGSYIVDFLCPSAKLVIEIDGGQHFSVGGQQKDMQRDNAMRSLGLRVLRFSDTEVLGNLTGVLEEIWRHL